MIYSKKKQNLILTANTISEEEMFPEIVKILIEIKISGTNNISTFKNQFGNFIKTF